MYAIVDSEVFYAYNLEIQAEKQPQGQFFEVSNSPVDAVGVFSAKLHNTGRNNDG